MSDRIFWTLLIIFGSIVALELFWIFFKIDAWIDASVTRQELLADLQSLKAKLTQIEERSLITKDMKFMQFSEGNRVASVFYSLNANKQE